MIEKYSRDNGITMVLDVSSQQTPVLYASPSVDITKEIIEMYDKNAGGSRRPGACYVGSQGARDGRSEAACG